MATNHVHRLLIGVPAANAPAYNAWIRNHLNPEGDDWLSVALSASGSPPATHYCCCAQLTDDECREILLALAEGTSLTRPGQWQNWSRAQRRQWVRNVAIPTIHAERPVRIRHMDNDGDWDDVAEILANLGLMFVEGA